MSKFVTRNTHTVIKTMHTRTMHGFDFVCEYLGYREE